MIASKVLVNDKTPDNLQIQKQSSTFSVSKRCFLVLTENLQIANLLHSKWFDLVVTTTDAVRRC